jgi:hypothetical protein
MAVPGFQGWMIGGKVYKAETYEEAEKKAKAEAKVIEKPIVYGAPSKPEFKPEPKKVQIIEPSPKEQFQKLLEEKFYNPFTQKWEPGTKIITTSAEALEALKEQHRTIAEMKESQKQIKPESWYEVPALQKTMKGSEVIKFYSEEIKKAQEQIPALEKAYKTFYVYEKIPEEFGKAPWYVKAGAWYGALVATPYISPVEAMRADYLKYVETGKWPTTGEKAVEVGKYVGVTYGVPAAIGLAAGAIAAPIAAKIGISASTAAKIGFASKILTIGYVAAPTTFYLFERKSEEATKWAVTGVLQVGAAYVGAKAGEKIGKQILIRTTKAEEAFVARVGEAKYGIRPVEEKALVKVGKETIPIEAKYFVKTVPGEKFEYAYSIGKARIGEIETAIVGKTITFAREPFYLTYGKGMTVTPEEIVYGAGKYVTKAVTPRMWATIGEVKTAEGLGGIVRGITISPTETVGVPYKPYLTYVLEKPEAFGITFPATKTPTAIIPISFKPSEEKIQLKHIVKYEPQVTKGIKEIKVEEKERITERIKTEIGQITENVTKIIQIPTIPSTIPKTERIQTQKILEIEIQQPVSIKIPAQPKPPTYPFVYHWPESKREFFKAPKMKLGEILPKPAKESKKAVRVLADPLSMTIAEIRKWGKAYHPKPVKPVKAKFVERLYWKGAALRFPTAKESKRSKKIKLWRSKEKMPILYVKPKTDGKRGKWYALKFKTWEELRREKKYLYGRAWMKTEGRKPRKRTENILGFTPRKLW